MKAAGSFVTLSCICAVTFVLARLEAQETANTSEETAAATEQSAERTKRRLEWNSQATVGAYEDIGKRNPAWDDSARRALTEFGRWLAGASTNATASGKIIRDSCREAVKAGCDDPLVAYLHAYYSLQGAEQTSALVKAGHTLEKSDYPAVIKFYVFQQVARRSTNETDQAKLYGIARKYLAEALQDQTMPIEDVYAHCQPILMATRRKGELNESIYRTIERPLFDNWPNESVSYLLKGTFLWQHAWAARGRGLRDTVTEKGANAYFERLEQASVALDKAWELDSKNPQIALEMLRLELSQGKDRKRFETWFERAMKLNTNFYQAASQKLLYLEPKWYGSREEMLEFARECVQNTNWGGPVAMVVIDAHTTLAAYAKLKGEDAVKEYWKQPEVWTDIKAAYGKYLRQNPRSVSGPSRLALYAYLCAQYEEFNRMVTELKRVEYSVFKGKENFEKLVRMAREKAKKQE